MKSTLSFGLLTKAIIASFSVAIVAFLMNYLYIDQKQSEQLSYEISQLRKNSELGLSNIIVQKTDQLTLSTEELFTLVNATKPSVEQANTFLKLLWQRLKHKLSLNSLHIRTHNESILYGEPLPVVLDEQLNRGISQPKRHFICTEKCQVGVSIPIFIGDTPAVVTLFANVFPIALSASQTLNVDVGVVNLHDNNNIHDYSVGFLGPFSVELLTNFDKHKNMLNNSVITNITQEQILADNFYSPESDSIDSIYYWGVMIGETEHPMLFLLIKDLSPFIDDYKKQKNELLINSAILSFGIIMAIVFLSYFPLKKLSILTHAIMLIGKKDYAQAKRATAKTTPSITNDELSNLECEMETTIEQLLHYESEIITTQNELRIQATVDSTTGMLNRNAFIQDMVDLRNERALITLAFLDLDGFKPVNDNLGHEAGDTVLKDVGNRLSTLLQNGVKSYRLGGDEFVLAISLSALQNTAFYTRITDLFRADFKIKKHQIRITASVGIATECLSKIHYSELFRRADIAMYQAKKQGKNNFCVFENTMMEESNLRFLVTNEFTSALAKSQLFLYFQPIVNVHTGRLVKLEALCRWQHPKKGFIRPDVFVSILEDTPYIKTLTYWVAKYAITTAAYINGKSPHPIAMSINISASQVNDLSSITAMKRCCDEVGLDYSLLELEITETSLIADFKKAEAWIIAANEIGFKIAIDDFGTGYSSLSYLTRFHFDTVKVDRSLINNIPDDPNQIKIVKTVTGLIHSLNALVVIEGVEEASQLSALKALNIDMVQGYYFARPMPEADLCEALKQYKMDDAVWSPQTVQGLRIK